MNATPPAYEVLFPTRPLASREQRMVLNHPGGSQVAWIARIDRSDLAGRAPESYLHASELRQAATFRFDARKETYLLGRLAAKIAAAPALTESDWTQIELTHGVFGQPLVNHPTRHGVEVSLSHSDKQAVAIAFLRECPMAVDLETVDHDRAATVKSELQFLPEERQWIHSGAVEETAAYVLLWTVREALGKVLRCGITCPLELLAVNEIRPLAEGIWESRYHNFHQLKCLSWVRADQVFSLALPRNFQVSAAASAPSE